MRVYQRNYKFQLELIHVNGRLSYAYPSGILYRDKLLRDIKRKV
mgnify:CR=1 FL=1